MSLSNVTTMRIGHLLLAVSGVQVKHLNPEEFTPGPGPRCSRRCVCGVRELVLAARWAKQSRTASQHCSAPRAVQGGGGLGGTLG